MSPLEPQSLLKKTGGDPHHLPGPGPKHGPEVLGSPPGPPAPRLGASPSPAGSDANDAGASRASRRSRRFLHAPPTPPPPPLPPVVERCGIDAKNNTRKPSGQCFSSPRGGGGYDGHGMVLGDQTEPSGNPPRPGPRVLTCEIGPKPAGSSTESRLKVKLSQREFD